MGPAARVRSIGELAARADLAREWNADEVQDQDVPRDGLAREPRRAALGREARDAVRWILALPPVVEAGEPAARPDARPVRERRALQQSADVDPGLDRGGLVRPQHGAQRMRDLRPALADADQDDRARGGIEPAQVLGDDQGVLLDGAVLQDRDQAALDPEPVEQGALPCEIGAGAGLAPVEPAGREQDRRQVEGGDAGFAARLVQRLQPRELGTEQRLRAGVVRLLRQDLDQMQRRQIDREALRQPLIGRLRRLLGQRGEGSARARDRARAGSGARPDSPRGSTWRPGRRPWSRSPCRRSRPAPESGRHPPRNPKSTAPARA